MSGISADLWSGMGMGTSAGLCSTNWRPWRKGWEWLFTSSSRQRKWSLIGAKFRYYNAGSMKGWLKLTIISGMVSFPQSVATQLEDDHHAHHHCSSNLPTPRAQIMHRHQQLVAQTLGEEDAVILVDESGMAKQGRHSAAVAPQYCGALGKVANCQVGVYLGDASRKGYTLLDGQLFVPECWFADDQADLCDDVGMPADLTFKTKPELAVEQVRNLMERKVVPARWLAADALYGDSPTFRDAVADLGLWYFTEVACSTLIWRRHPALIIPAWSGKGRKPTRQRLKTPSNRAYRVDELLTRLGKMAWVRGIVKEGSKGPIVCDFAFVRVTECRQGLPGPRLWLVIRRNVADPSEVKFYLSNAPEKIESVELVRMSGMRWPVELSFEEGKTELGMDQYETRSWLGWHHHML